MVHINRVATVAEVDNEKGQFEKLTLPKNSRINLAPEDTADDFSATVYGSKWAAQDLPKHEMPVSAAARIYPCHDRC